jgi:protocatechuate 3,4-dioxygenase beta subunit
MPNRDGAEAKPAVGTGTLSGTVFVAGSGVPARRARVTLSGADAGPARNVVTDAQGRFTFVSLPAGRYTLSASKPGHLTASYGQARPGRPGTPIQLDEGQKFEANLQMTRGGVLTGTVLDEDGEAIPGTQVRALRFVFQNGERTLQSAGNGSTDDRGIYRIYGLQPGEYVVGATPRNINPGPAMEAVRAELEAMRQQGPLAGRGNGPLAAAVAARLEAAQAAGAAAEETGTGYAPVYYPGTTALSQAAATTLGPGEERSGVDFQLQRVAVARISGMVVNSTGQETQNVQLMLIDLNQAAPGMGNSATRVDNEGRFTFANVAPGQYRISARAVVGERGGGRGGRMNAPPEGRGGPVAEMPRLWASTDVTVDGRDLPNVILSMQNGLSASGRVVFQGALPQPTDLTRLRINFAPADFGPGREPGGMAAGRPDASGKFSLVGIAPGRYRVNVGGAPQGWTLESAIIGGHDALDFPFEVKAGQNIGSATITFTDRSSELTGAVTDARGEAVYGYTLILFPADQRYWIPQSRRIRTARPATDGRYAFNNVPPGDYKIAPVVDAEPGAWFDPAFLQELDQTALRVSIGEGESKVQNVRLADR